MGFDDLIEEWGSNVLPNHKPERPNQSQVLPYRSATKCGGLNQTPYGSTALLSLCGRLPLCSQQCSLMQRGICFLQVSPPPLSLSASSCLCIPVLNISLQACSPSLDTVSLIVANIEEKGIQLIVRFV